MSGHAIFPGAVKGYPLASYCSQPFLKVFQSCGSATLS